MNDTNETWYLVCILARLGRHQVGIICGWYNNTVTPLQIMTGTISRPWQEDILGVDLAHTEAFLDPRTLCTNFLDVFAYAWTRRHHNLG